jgi:hypothetical protein
MNAGLFFAQSPDLLNALKELVKRGVAYAIDLQRPKEKKYQLALFYVRLFSTVTYSMYEANGGHLPEVLQDSTELFLKELNTKLVTFLKDKDIPPPTRRLAWTDYTLFALHLKLMGIETEGIGSLEQFLCNWICTKQFFKTEAEIPSWMEQTLDRVQLFFLSQIKERELEIDSNKLGTLILDSLGVTFRKVDPDTTDWKWIYNRDQLTLTCGEWTIDLQLGTLSFKKEKVSCGEIKIEKNAVNYRTLFGEYDPKRELRGRVVYFAPKDQEGAVRIYDAKSAHMMIQYRAPKQKLWWQYFSKETVNRFLSDRFPKTYLSDNYHFWFEVDEANPLNGRLLVTSKNDWTTPLVAIHHTFGYRKEDSQKPLSSLSPTPLSEVQAALIGIEQHTHVEVEYTVDDSHHGSFLRATLPDLITSEGHSLRFKKVDDGRVIWEQDARFALCRSDVPQSLKLPENIITLRDGKGETLILVPFTAIDKNSTLSFAHDSRFRKETDQTRELGTHTPILVYKYGEIRLPHQKEPVLDLIPGSLKAKIHLIYLKIQAREYETALYWLNSLSEIDSFDKSEEKLVCVILSLLQPVNTKHKSPKTNLIVLKVWKQMMKMATPETLYSHYSLFVRYEIVPPSPFGKPLLPVFMKQLASFGADLYLKYCQHINALPDSFQLDVEAEKALIKEINQYEGSNSHYTVLVQQRMLLLEEKALTSVEGLSHEIVSIDAALPNGMRAELESIYLLDGKSKTDLRHVLNPTQYADFETYLLEIRQKIISISQGGQVLLLTKMISHGDPLFRSKMRTFLREQLAFLIQYSDKDPYLGPSPYAPFFNPQPVMILWALNLLDATDGKSRVDLLEGVTEIKIMNTTYPNGYGRPSVQTWTGSYHYFFDHNAYLGKYTADPFNRVDVFQKYQPKLSRLSFPRPNTQPTKPKKALTSSAVGEFPIAEDRLDHPLAFGELDTSPWNRLRSEKPDLFALEKATPPPDVINRLPQQMPETYIKENLKSLTLKAYETFKKDMQTGHALLTKNAEPTLSVDQLDAVKEATQDSKGFYQERKVERQQAIQRLLEAYPPEKRHELALLKASGKLKTPTPHELTRAFLTNNKKDYRLFAYYLTDSQIQELDKLVAEYLVAEIHLARAERIEKGCSALQRALSNGKLDEARFHSDRVREELRSTYEKFKGDSTRAFLVFTYLSGIEPRADQVEDCMRLREPCILQRMMGSGKTSVLAAMDAIMCAQERKQGVFFVDASMHANLCSILSASQYTVFNQKVWTFNFSRDTITAEKLDETIERFDLSQKRGDLLVLTPMTLQLLDAEFFVIEHEIAETYQTFLVEENAEKRAALTTKINDIRNKHVKLQALLNRFKQKAKGLGDEIDKLLKAELELNLPYGNKEPVPREKILLVQILFTYLTSKDMEVNGKSFAELLDFKKGKYRHISPEVWREILTQCIRRMCADFKLLHLQEQEETLIKEVVAYALGDSQASDHLKTFVSHLHEQADPEIRNAAELIAFLPRLVSMHEKKKGLIFSLMRSIPGRHFGRSRLKPGEAVPYRATDTPASTKIGDPIEAVMKQFLIAAAKGTDFEQFKMIVEELHVAAKNSLSRVREQRSGEGVDSTAEGRFIEKWTGFSLSSLNDPEHLPEAHLILCRSPEGVMIFEAMTAEKYARLNVKKMTSNAQVFPDLLGELCGMSGTIANRDGYHKALQTKATDPAYDQQDFLGAIVYRMLEREDVTSVVAVEPSNVLELYDQMYARYEGQTKEFPDAILDAGAFMNYAGLGDKEDDPQIARSLLDFMHKKGVRRKDTVLFFMKKIIGQDAHGHPVYSEESNQFAALKRVYTGEKDDNGNDLYEEFLFKLNNTSNEELKRFGLNPDNYVVFYDERHTTGTDILLNLDAEAWVTVDNTPLTELFQTLLRERKFLSTQRAHFAVTKEFEERRPAGVSPLAHILLTCLTEEKEKLTLSLRRSIYQKAHAAILKQCRATIESQLTEEGSYSEKNYLFDQIFHEMIFTAQTMEMYPVFHAEELEVSIRDGFQLFIKKFMKRFKEKVDLIPMISFDGRSLDRIVQESHIHKTYTKILEEFQEIDRFIETNLDKLPERELVSTPEGLADSHAGGEVEAEEEVETEQEQEQQIEIAMELQLELEVLNFLIQQRDLYKERLPLASGKTLAEKSFDSVFRSSDCGLDIEQVALLLPQAQKIGIAQQKNYVTQFAQRYHTLFRECRLYATKNFRTTLNPHSVYHYNHAPTLFHEAHKKPRHLLVHKNEDETFDGVLLSAKEAAHFKDVLLEMDDNNGYTLMTLDGVLEVSKSMHHYVNPKNDNEVKDLLFNANLLAGNITNLHALNMSTRLARWEEEGDQGELKTRFLHMQVLRDQHEKGQLELQGMRNDLSFIGFMHSRADQSRSEEEIRAITNPDEIFDLDDLEVKLVSADQVKFVSPQNIMRLLKEEQIRAIPTEKLPHISTRQVQFLTIEQLNSLADTQFDEESRLQGLVRDGIKDQQLLKLCELAIQDGDENEGIRKLFKYLSKEQLDTLNNPEILPYLPEWYYDQLNDCLKDRCTPDYIHDNFDERKLNYFPDSIFVRFSADQLKKLSKKRLLEVREPEIIPKIENPGHVHSEMAEHLTDEQIARITYEHHELVDSPFFEDIQKFRKVPLTVELVEKINEERVKTIAANITNDDSHPGFFSKEWVPHVKKVEVLEILFDVSGPRSMLTEEQLRLLPSRVLVRHPSPEVLKFIDPEQIPNVPTIDSYIDHLSDEQLKHLSQRQVELLTQIPVIQKLPKELLKYVTERQIPHLTDDQLKELPPEKVELIKDLETLNRLPNEQLQYLCPEAISLDGFLTTEKLAYIGYSKEAIMKAVPIGILNSFVQEIEWNDDGIKDPGRLVVFMEFLSHPHFKIEDKFIDLLAFCAKADIAKIKAENLQSWLATLVEKDKLQGREKTVFEKLDPTQMVNRVSGPRHFPLNLAKHLTDEQARLGIHYHLELSYSVLVFKTDHVLHSFAGGSRRAFKDLFNACMTREALLKDERLLKDIDTCFHKGGEVTLEKGLVEQLLKKADFPTIHRLGSLWFKISLVCGQRPLDDEAYIHFLKNMHPPLIVSDNDRSIIRTIPSSTFVRLREHLHAYLFSSLNISQLADWERIEKVTPKDREIFRGLDINVQKTVREHVGTKFQGAPDPVLAPDPISPGPAPAVPPDDEGLDVVDKVPSALNVDAEEIDLHADGKVDYIPVTRSPSHRVREEQEGTLGTNVVKALPVDKKDHLPKKDHSCCVITACAVVLLLGTLFVIIGAIGYHSRHLVLPKWFTTMVNAIGGRDGSLALIGVGSFMMLASTFMLIHTVRKK